MDDRELPDEPERVVLSDEMEAVRRRFTWEAEDVIVTPVGGVPPRRDVDPIRIRVARDRLRRNKRHVGT